MLGVLRAMSRTGWPGQEPSSGRLRRRVVIVVLVTAFTCDLRIDFLQADTVEPFLGER